MARRPAKSPAIQLRQESLALRAVLPVLDLDTAPALIPDELLKTAMESWSWANAPDDDTWLELSDLARPLSAIKLPQR